MIPRGIWRERVWAKVPTYINNRKKSLQERSVSGTWLGLWPKTGQNLVAIGPDKVVRVRTIQRRQEAERWSPHIITTLQSTPQKWDTPGEVTPEGLPIDAEDIDTGEPFDAEPEQTSEVVLGAPRRPRLSHAKRQEISLS